MHTGLYGFGAPCIFSEDGSERVRKLIDRREFLKRSLAAPGLVTGDPVSANRPNADGAKDSSVNLSVAAEMVLYEYVPANNGADPLWADGLTTVVRGGGEVFASGLETVPDVNGLSRCRWMLFKKYDSGWKLEARDQINLNREPCPLAVLRGEDILLSVNPKQADVCVEYCPTHPEILRFNARNPHLPYDRLIPVWEKNPGLMDHSYRTLAVDRINHELIIFQNYRYRHAEW
ncbi:MAG: hypothetical protein AB7V39_28545, partial [Nitrospiraceae bacterium]